MDKINADEVIADMSLTFGLLTARHNNDPDGFYALLGEGDPEVIANALFGLADFALGQLKVQSAITGMKVTTLLQTLSMIANTALPDIIEKRNREA